MKDTHADRKVRAVKALRSSLLVVLKRVDEVCALVEAEAAQAADAPLSGSGAADDTPQDGPAPRVDRHTLLVHWAGRDCYLGYTLPFRLLERLAQRPNQYLRVELLMEDLWGGTRAPSTVRTAVSVLRARLTKAGMGDLAGMIDGSNPGHYGLILPPGQGRPNSNQTANKR